MPASIEGRGIVLVALAAVSVGLPAVLGHRLLAQDQQVRYVSSAEALLAVALRSHLDAAAGTTPGNDEWVSSVAEDSERVLWSGAVDENGDGVEFRRRTDLPYEGIAAQVRRTAGVASLRPLLVHGRPSPRFVLLTMPARQPGTTLAAVINVEQTSDVAGAMVLLGLVAVGGLGVTLAWFHYGMQRPLRNLHNLMLLSRDGLAEAVLDNGTPEELRNLVRSVESTQQELRKWRGEATQLRHSLDVQVSAKTRRMTRALHEATREADTDALTLLRNRRAMERELPRLFQQHQEAGRELTAVLVDVDNFKALNDTLCHQAGDELLAFLGELIRATIRRQTDIAVRYGGDEFVLFLPDTSVPEASAIARRLHDLFAQRVKTLDTVGPAPGLSAGVAASRQHRVGTWQNLLKMADQAMYHAKQNKLGVATVEDVRAAAGHE